MEDQTEQFASTTKPFLLEEIVAIASSNHNGVGSVRFSYTLQNEGAANPVPLAVLKVNIFLIFQAKAPSNHVHNKVKPQQLTYTSNGLACSVVIAFNAGPLGCRRESQTSYSLIRSTEKHTPLLDPDSSGPGQTASPRFVGERHQGDVEGRCA